MNKILFFFSPLLFSFTILAQTDSTINPTTSYYKLSGFLEAFYAYDNFYTPTRQPFGLNHNTQRELAINTAILHLAYNYNYLRFNFAPHTGKYVLYNFSQEPSVFKYIYLANAGLAIDKQKRVWLDVGILESHLGSESIKGFQNWTLTRSLAAEGSPYFLSGAKLFYTQANYSLGLIICNGWQRISNVSNSRFPSVGTQFTWSPTDNFTFNHSTYIGKEENSFNGIRLFNNLYSTFKINSRAKIFAGFDFGYILNEQIHWFSPLFIIKNEFFSYLHAAIRVEYFQDHYNKALFNNNEPIDILGISLNTDVIIKENVKLRFEPKMYNSRSNSHKPYLFFTTALLFDINNN
jgi:hypothetical protein